MTNIRHTIIGMSSLILSWVNLIYFQNAYIGAVCTFIFLFSLSHLLGSRFVQAGSNTQKLTIGLITALCAIMLGGSAIYYFGTVNQISLSILLAIILIIATLVSTKYKIIEYNTEDKIPHTLRIAFIISIIAWWIAIIGTQTTESIRSLWLIVDPKILIAITISLIITLAIIARSASNNATLMLAILFSSALSLAFWIFPLGYGFDPFIHRTTIEHIAQFGTIAPKPFYYIGQYALELVAIIVFSLPLKLVDGLLVPILASILIPLSCLFSIKHLGNNWKMSFASLFLLPLGAFISTTPQSLAYIFVTCLVILSLPMLLEKIKSKEYLIFLGIIALSAIIIHPLAGIPAILFYAFVFESRVNISSIAHKISITILSILSAITIPIIFVMQSIFSGLNINFSLTNLSWSQLNITGFFSNNYNAWLDGFYLVIDNYLWIIIVLTIIGVYFAKKENLPRGIYVCLYCAIASIIGYLILTLALQFEFLIEYERSNYSDRLITLAIIFMLPFVFIALSSIWLRLENKNASLKLTFIILMAFVGTSMIYGAYPRHDNYARSAGFNVSQADIDAVYAIDKYAGDQDYIVLANQAVSSVALEAFGFAKYFNQDTFYYPIPTGGKLYNYYLEMTSNNGPDDEIMSDALDYTGANLGFFVINDYWWESERIIEQAKNQAIDWFALGDGSVTIFVFEKND